jgi:hypothetical protein
MEPPWDAPVLAMASRAGRPSVDREIRDLIRQISRAKPLWGAPRIHGELSSLLLEQFYLALVEPNRVERRQECHRRGAVPCARSRVHLIGVDGRPFSSWFPT